MEFKLSILFPTFGVVVDGAPSGRDCNHTIAGGACTKSCFFYSLRIPCMLFLLRVTLVGYYDSLGQSKEFRQI